MSDAYLIVVDREGVVRWLHHRAFDQPQPIARRPTALASRVAPTTEVVAGDLLDPASLGRGWYFGTWLWQIRGAIDLLTGGVGMRRGRRDPNVPAVGIFAGMLRAIARRAVEGDADRHRAASGVPL